MEIQERQLEDMSFDELKEYARVLEMVVLFTIQFVLLKLHYPNM